MRVNKDDFLNGLIVVLLIGYKYILMWSRTNLYQCNDYWYSNFFSYYVIKEKNI